MLNIGDRAGVILKEEGGFIFLIGYGVYLGKEIPVEAVGPMAEQLRKDEVPNPKIKLDSGSVVYGCECYWGDESGLKRKIEKNPNVIDVDINDIREKYLQN
jgi:hypothetical protein